MYELNKSILLNERAMKPVEIKDALRKIKIFISSVSDKFFMLLCREKNDFTLFAMYNKTDVSLNITGADIHECLSNRGEILSIEPTENKDAFEIWIKTNDVNEAGEVVEDVSVYYFFPYDAGVIEEGIQDD
jgi:hypothetical protein